VEADLQKQGNRHSGSLPGLCLGKVQNDQIWLQFSRIFNNGGDWRSKSLALPLMFSTTLDGFYFANRVLAAVFFFDYQHIKKNLKISLK
jgi:hypothetical protein